MNEQTEKALRGSIAHWEGIVAGTEMELGASNCALCHLFNYEPNYCKGCPVANATQKAFCADSPYDNWQYLTGGRTKVADTPERKAAAQAELEFLISLLPTEGGAK